MLITIDRTIFSCYTSIELARVSESSIEFSSSTTSCFLSRALIFQRNRGGNVK